MRNAVVLVMLEVMLRWGRSLEAERGGLRSREIRVGSVGGAMVEGSRRIFIQRRRRRRPRPLAAEAYIYRGMAPPAQSRTRHREEQLRTGQAP
ncbi:unnamed protein product [Pleuronectes platessa]|uniref:Secreted protein n=1 Tax=Pleuronectes platessa TaxID=8262 RepID=A0A9N7YXB1_PLEPL|nr:unnamed protein product [Pleuronectes platessa]